MIDFFQRTDFEIFDFAIKILNYCKTQAKIGFLCIKFFAIPIQAIKLSSKLKD